jgi:predicted acylesterase/phospholipase RssA
MDDLNNKIKIKHLVIPGGGPSGLQAIGILQTLSERGVWALDDIESIYATSAGTLVAVILALKFGWEDITDYVVKRPWDKFVHFDLMTLIGSLNSKGVFDKTLVYNFLKPFLLARDMDLDITMKAFYEKTLIGLHFYTFELISFKVVELSYNLHPDLKLLDAVYMSCAIPILFKPFVLNEGCYIDGGVACNNPIRYALAQIDVTEHNTILSISHDYGDKNDGSQHRNQLIKGDDELSMMEYFFYMIITLVQCTGKLLREKERGGDVGEYVEICYKTRRLNLEDVHNVIVCENQRQGFIDYGKEVAEKWWKEKEDDNLK